MRHPDDGPIACSLDDAGRRARGKVWTAVIAGGLRTRLATPTGVRLEFDADLATGHALLDLVASSTPTSRPGMRCSTWSHPSERAAAGPRGR